MSDSDYSVLKHPVIVCIRPANTTRYRLVNNIDRIACSCVLYVPATNGTAKERVCVLRESFTPCWALEEVICFCSLAIGRV